LGWTAAVDAYGDGLAKVCIGKKRNHFADRSIVAGRIPNQA